MIYFHRFFSAHSSVTDCDRLTGKGVCVVKKRETAEKGGKSFNCQLFSFALPLTQALLPSIDESLRRRDGEGRAIVGGEIFIVKIFA